MKKALMLAGLSLAATGANAAIVQLQITGGFHTAYALGSSQTQGALQASTIYGDGANAGVTPDNICLSGTTITCTNAKPAAGGFAGTSGWPAGTYQEGNNGPYWGQVFPGTLATSQINFVPASALAAAANPNATYNGIFQYDTITGQILGGTIAWNGAYGFEVTVPLSATASAAGSFFSWVWLNGNINLATGVRTTLQTGDNPNAICFLGAAGNWVVGPVLCGTANNPNNYSYHLANTGFQATYTPLGGGQGLLTLVGNRCTNTTTLDGEGNFANCTGNNLFEQWQVQVIPVPAAVWLFGSALGLLGFAARRRQAAA